MEYNLFLVVSPGLEDLALKELEHKCPVHSVTKVKGGVEVMADLEWVITAHCLLKIPTRILMRVEEFKVRDFPKLYKKCSALKWNQFLSHPKPEWKISCSLSRLLHTKKIQEVIRSALEDALIRQPLKKDWEKKNFSPQTFYVRIFQDTLTLSLDLTGDPLYKRGLQKLKGKAPLRESFAAAMIFELFQGIKNKVTLIDPMCGSGTFLTEALSFHQPLHLRPFAFESAPFFRGKAIKLPPPSQELPIKKILGTDQNEDLIQKIKQETSLDLKVMDSLKSSLISSEETRDQCVMICNPPYGERIKIQGKRGSFLKSAWKKFLTQDAPFRFAWIIPSDMDDLFKNPPGYKTLKKIHLRNGGLPVTFWVWEKVNLPLDDKTPDSSPTLPLHTE